MTKAKQTEKEIIQSSKQYKSMTRFKATGIAEGFLEGTPEEEIAAWQYLHDTRLAYQLQGWFGRNAAAMIEHGIIYE